MLSSHLLALVPLMFLFLISLWIYNKAILQAIPFAYAIVLAYIAIVEVWELMFFPFLFGTALVNLLIFVYDALQGDWL